MKNSLLASAVLGLGALAGLWWGQPAMAPAAEALASSAPVVASPEVSLDSTLLVTTGRIGAGGEEPLLARTSGHVRNIFYSGGEYARLGQVLVKLDNHTFVTAPRAGFLGPCEHHIGEFLTAKTAVTTISRYSYLVATVLLPGDWQGGIHPGDSVRVWSQRPAGRVAVGVVGAMGPPGPDDASVEVILTSRAPFRIGELVYVRLRDTRPQIALR